MTNTIARTARAGFTLVEVLVTLVLIALLVGVIVPSVIGQLDRGEPTRVAQDLEAVRSGAKLFRVEVKRYPATLEQLTEAPGASGVNWIRVTDFNGATISDGLLGQWNGPYLEGSTVMDESTALNTALGGEIQPIFSSGTLAGTPYLTVRVVGLSPADIANVSELIDGNATITDDDTGGRLRSTVAGDTLLFLAVPIN